jgi:hypothetical protein
MARNRYFNQYTTASEQNLNEDLIIEAMKIYGIQAYYLPRTHVNLDKFYGEDASVLYDDAIDLEMYVKTFDGYGGQLDFISKFGIQVDKQITFSISQKRFTQALKTSLVTEYSYNMLTEEGDELLLDGTDVYDYSAIARPREGDLIWIPMLSSMFEIKFTEYQEYFYQLGKVYTYEMRCDRFEYQSERLDTGVEPIDAIEDNYSMATNVLDELLLEDETKLLLEDGNTIVLEGDVIVERSPNADNDFIRSEIDDDDVIDFSESNPFALTRIY